MPAIYTHQHTEAVLATHSWRTASNSAAYLLPHLSPSHKILDVGCGPGTITADLAALISEGEGSVIAIDTSADVLDKARALADGRGLNNVLFEEGDVFNLKYGDASFDVVHVHQVLQHIHDPVTALRELRRVTKPGGLIAVREADFGSFAWYPANPQLDKWRELYTAVARANGGEPNAGRRLLAWSLQAGFDRAQVTCTLGTWCYVSPEEVQWWGGSWAERSREGGSGFGSGAVQKGFATGEELEMISEGWKEWMREEHAWFGVPHGEILIRV